MTEEAFSPTPVLWLVVSRKSGGVLFMFPTEAQATHAHEDRVVGPYLLVQEQGAEPTAKAVITSGRSWRHVPMPAASDVVRR